MTKSLWEYLFHYEQSKNYYKSSFLRKGDRHSPIIDFDYLLTKVSQINKASVRASESIQAMRNNAWFAKPASKPDTSPFKLPE